jgi:hypothetical protein
MNRLLDFLLWLFQRPGSSGMQVPSKAILTHRLPHPTLLVPNWKSESAPTTQVLHADNVVQNPCEQSGHPYLQL